MDASQFRVKLPASAKLKNARASDKRYMCMHLALGDGLITCLRPPRGCWRGAAWPQVHPGQPGVVRGARAAAGL